MKMKNSPEYLHLQNSLYLCIILSSGRAAGEQEQRGFFRHMGKARPTVALCTILFALSQVNLCKQYLNKIVSESLNSNCEL